MHVLLIDLKTEIIIHNIPVHPDSSIKEIEKFIDQKRKEYPQMVRILLLEGEARVMSETDCLQKPREPLKAAGNR